jgi:hypothetical protein
VALSVNPGENLAAVLARWAPVDHDVQVALLLGRRFAPALCSNPNVTEGAVRAAFDLVDAGSRWLLASDVLAGGTFQLLPVDVLQICADLYGDAYRSTQATLYLTEILTRRPDVASAIIRKGGQCWAVLAASCQLHIDWHSPRVSELLGVCAAEDLVTTAAMTEGMVARRGVERAPDTLHDPSGMTSKRKLDELAKFVFDSADALGVCPPRASLIAAALLDNGCVPADQSERIEQLFMSGRMCLRMFAMADLTLDEPPPGLFEASAGAGAEHWAVALSLAEAGFDGSFHELADLAARLV